MIITPEHPDFYSILHGTIPPGFSTNTLVVSADTGLLRPVTDEELTDYVYGGEYDEVDPLTEEEWHNQI
jgi:hypothetical protein